MLYAADVIESAIDALARLPGVDEKELGRGSPTSAGSPSPPGAGFGFVAHKSTAVR